MVQRLDRLCSTFTCIFWPINRELARKRKQRLARPAAVALGAAGLARKRVPVTGARLGSLRDEEARAARVGRRGQLLGGQLAEDRRVFGLEHGVGVLRDRRHRLLQRQPTPDPSCPASSKPGALLHARYA